VAANDPTPAPAGQESVKAAAPAPTSIKLPPPKEAPFRPPLTAEGLAQAVARLDVALAAAVIAFAFLAASFAIKNSDYWLHLALGRDIVSGSYSPFSGADPYTYTAGYWANHSWLYELAIYPLHEAVGDAALVALKALLVAGLAAVMLAFRRPGQSLWVPAVCTALAVLAMSPRLVFNPTLVSFLFLALTLLLLQLRPRPGTPLARDPRWWLVPLFVLWVNLDAWFLLGPITLALWLAGELLQKYLPRLWAQDVTPEPDGPRRLGLILAAGLAACLLNPHHVWAFTLPNEVAVSPALGLLQNDPNFHPYFLSPALMDYWYKPSYGLNPAGLALYVLILVSLISFVANRRGWRWGRFLVWLACCGLALYRWQALPFFAVVAGPVSALNFQEALARRQPAAVAARLEWAPALRSLGIVTAVVAGFLVALKLGAFTWLLDWLVELITATPNISRVLNYPVVPVPFLVFAGFVLVLFLFVLAPLLRHLNEVVASWTLGGRLLTVFGVVLLLVACWPGWLQAGGFAWPWQPAGASDPWSARRVGWGADPDQSLIQAAQKLKELREQKALPEDARGFASAPQFVNYCAWFCPQEKGYFDYRFRLRDEKTTKAFLELQKLLVPKLGVPDEALSGLPTALRQREAAKLEAERRALLRKVFLEQNIHHVVLTGPNAGIAVHAMYLARDPYTWTLLYMDGRTAILAYQDPYAAHGAALVAGSAGGLILPGPLARFGFDPNAQAFGKVPEKEQAPQDGRAVPTAGGDWDRYINGPRPRSLAADEAMMQFLLFEDSKDPFRETSRNLWLQAGLVQMIPDSVPTAGAVPVAANVAGHIYLDGMRSELFVTSRDQGWSAALFLGLRAARRALKVNPDDPDAYYWMGQSYSRLTTNTQEGLWARRWPGLEALRHVQTVSALRALVNLQPNPVQARRAHLELARLYEQVGYLDLALKHRTEALALQRGAGPDPGEKEDAYRKRLGSFEKELERATADLDKRDLAFARQSKGLSPPEQALLALQHGLAEKALAAVEPTAEQKEGAALFSFEIRMKLLLNMGRLDDARTYFTQALTDPKDPTGANRAKLRALVPVALTEYAARAPFYVSVTPLQSLPAEEWFRFLLGAAEGNYHDADAALADMEPVLRQLAAQEAVRGLGMGLLNGAPGEPPAGYAAAEALRRLMRDQVLTLAADGFHAGPLAQSAMWQEADEDVVALRGLVALEVGDTARARDFFEQALRSAAPPTVPQPGAPVTGSLGAAAAVGSEPYPGDFALRPMALHYLGFIDQAR
jgi:tetratricopeptide (TPR) repeat protein